MMGIRCYQTIYLNSRLSDFLFLYYSILKHTHILWSQAPGKESVALIDYCILHIILQVIKEEKSEVT